MSTSREPELVALRKLAEDMAGRRGERVTTGHLLAAIASKPSTAADLLRDRRLDAEVLLKAARVVEDDQSDAIVRAVQRAREFAGRSGAREPGAVHLLFALCHDRLAAAQRAIEQCGTDVGKLRVAAMLLATGVAPPRRQTALPQPSPQTPARPVLRAPLGASTSRSTPRATTSSAPGLSGSSSTSATTASEATGEGGAACVEPGAAPPSATAMRGPTRSPAHTIKPAPLTPAPAPEPPTRPRKARHAMTLTRSAPALGLQTSLLDPTPLDPAASAARQARFTLDPKLFPLLTQLGRNLTAAAARDELDPVVGRDEEIERTLDVLAKRQANNPCLVGVAGVGKTSVARGIAQRIAAGKEVASLDDRIVIEIEPGALLGGTGVRGALAERIVQLKEEVRRSQGRVVLFFDEIHTLFGGDAGEEAASELKTALAKGEMPCIGASTVEEYRRAIENDAALARRFTPIEVMELSPEAAFLALEQVAPLFEKHHAARYSKEALAASVTWSVRYIPGKALPDKAVGILDLAGARARRRGLTEVTPEQIAEVVSELADVPTERLLETDGERMLRLESLLGERIVGHARALAKIATVLRRNASGFRSRRPIGSFLLLGPTGVGKTETAKAIAQCLFYSPDAMTRLDLSEYSEPHAIARLVGAPPGYVGHEGGGQLTEAVRRRPYQVVLLDEIEKAHRDVLEAFLQVFDEGRLTDGRGRTIDFTNTVIILTSNLGSEVTLAKSTRGKIGFGARAADEGRDLSIYEDAVVASARAALPPELYNRLDEVLTFAPLGRLDVAEVARRMLAALAEELERARGVRLDVSEEAIGALLEGGGYDPELGARPMRRAIGRMVEAPIAEMLLRGELARGDVATVDVEEGAIVVDAVTPRSRASA